MAQDGYVLAYVGNESNADVYFDDVQVTHLPGLQVQETEYDPPGCHWPFINVLFFLVRIQKKVRFMHKLVIFLLKDNVNYYS